MLWKVVHGVFESVHRGFQSLEHVDRCLWILLALKFLESYAYFALSQILVIYLHAEFQFNDIEAGTIYGGWGLSITIAGLSLACLTDTLGVRNALLIGFAISAVSYTCLSLLVYSRVWIYIIVLVLLPVGSSLGIPMLTIGIRRFTDSSNMGFAFGLFYTVMNIAAFAAGPVIDLVNFGKNPDEAVLYGLTGNRIVILTCGLCEVVAFGVTYYLLVVPVPSEEEEEEDDDDNDDDNSGKAEIEMQSSHSRHAMLPADDNKEWSDGAGSVIDGSKEDGKDSESSPDLSTPTSHYDKERIRRQSNPLAGEAFNLAEMQQLVYSKTFWRYMALSLFLLNLRAIFRHLDATFPTYLVREHGSHIPKGLIYSINPFMIIVLTPFIAAGLAHINDYDMFKIGSWFTGVACFPLALSNTIPAAIIFVVLLSIGEALWSPRTYSYAMTVAPVGKEATFSALASAPLFAAKIPVGLMSGYLLSRFMPEDGKQRPHMLWLIIGILTLSSAILINLCETCVKEPEPGNEDGADHSYHEKDDMLEDGIHRTSGNAIHGEGMTTKRGGVVYDQLDGSSTSLSHYISNHEEDGNQPSPTSENAHKNQKYNRIEAVSDEDIHPTSLSALDVHNILISEDGEEDENAEDSIADLMKKYS